ncbi:helix-turn-helix transcriptional regulator [Paenibacillus sedimenti]|uniref:AraC family transcriptional regulator n=1 Tax=Paenibacillus sedimenti TaxID=2770274 RepID=A0A926QKW7_9BACL|nr:AraC family transcriptional regulator [Paenibacillus sedimenti]MBD0383005.1 AraC family transcriptional regulator [Paenibacillus sedimenti]
MGYPQELREDTRLNDSNYPINVFHNQANSVQKGSMILFMHWHEHFEIIVMKAGHAVFHIDSKPYEVRVGDILIVPSGGLHTGYSTSEHNVEYVSIVFNRSLLRGQAMPDPAHAKWIEPFLNGQVTFPVKVASDNDRYLSYSSLLEQIIHEFDAKMKGYELIVRSLLYMLITLLSRAFMPAARSEAVSPPLLRNSERFKQLLQFMEAHFSEPMTVEQAAKHVNLNVFHFCKTFKKTTGSTFIEYMNLIRMREAERLLMETDGTMTEIAERIGCGNPNYFTKLFKQYKGITPSRFRKDTLN